MCSIQMTAVCEALFHWSTGKMDAYFLDIVLSLSWSGNSPTIRK